MMMKHLARVLDIFKKVYFLFIRLTVTHCIAQLVCDIYESRPHQPQRCWVMSLLYHVVSFYVVL